MKRRNIGPSTTLPVQFGLVALLALAALGVAGCEQALQMAPSNSTISLSASSTAVPLNGSLTITVTVTDGTGKAVNDGTLVNFSTTLGTLDPTSAQVVNGRATVHLLAGSVSGLATITATSGGVSAGALSVRIGPVPTRIVLAASATGGGAVSILATVFDSAGIAMAGVPVNFTTSAGTLASTVAYADALGQAFTTLYTTTDAIVTAESSGVRTTIAVRPGGTGTLTINIGMNPAAPVRNQNITFTATVTVPGTSAPLIDHYEWDWGGGYVIVTTGNVVTRAFEVEGRYGVTVKVYGFDGSVGVSRIEFYVD
ncbi:MAG: hypothetical protein NTY02_20450 [Acidobacteria bacterium]|nr:hypothetical protein [Acidobacteriota bacterium]